MKNYLKKGFIFVITIIMLINCFACASKNEEVKIEDKDYKTYKIGLCNYVDDASLNQIVENIIIALKDYEKNNDVRFEILSDNCNADANVGLQIINKYIASNVDLMIGVATPVVMSMQTLTEENKIPVIFAAVSDPVGTGIVTNLGSPEANITGTSDYLDTKAILDLMLLHNKDIKKVGLLYDVGQDSSTTPIREAKEYLNEKGIEVVEKTGTNIQEIMLATDALINNKVEAIFTPTDNTVMQAELSIYEKLADAKIPHFTGADSFALNGAFLGYGVDYKNLGIVTGQMVIDKLVNDREIRDMKVRTFDNGIATINIDICDKLSYDINYIKELYGPMCTEVNEIRTSESFE